LISYFIFLFLVLFQWKREGFAEFRLKKRKLSLTTISTTKTGRFCVKWFHMMKGVKIKCFLTLKTPKIKINLSFRRFFCFRLIMGFGVVFCVLGGHRLVIQGSKGISFVFWVKSGLKKQEPYFSGHHNGRILGNYRWRIVICFWKRTHCSPH